MKFINILFNVYIILLIPMYGNTQAYSIKSFHSDYDTLRNYRSVNIELGLEEINPYVWEKTFEFNFDFPFYDSTYKEVIIDSDAVGLFPNSPNYNFNLFSGSYIIDVILDTTYLFSEVRYATLNKDSLKALVIEYHNVYNKDEFEENGVNHKINFQLWFKENGIIELHFGEINLESCSYYFPGQGFSFDKSNPDGNIYGPWCSINNNDETQGAFFQGNHNNPELVYDNFDNVGVLTSIPPKGFVVQFIPSNLLSIKGNNKLLKGFWIAQNRNEIEIRGRMNDFISCEVFDISGRKITEFYSNHYRIPALSSKFAILKINHKQGYEVHKIIVY